MKVDGEPVIMYGYAACILRQYVALLDEVVVKVRSKAHDRISWPSSLSRTRRSTAVMIGSANDR